MKGNIAKRLIVDLLQSAGITVNGNKAWDVKIYNEKVYPRILHEGSLGTGESYMDSWWDCNKLDEFFFHVIRTNLEYKLRHGKTPFLQNILAKILNFQTKYRALEVGKKHYDLGNTLFECMLDSRMNYTCGYWKEATNLEEAQVAKLDLVCQKLQLKPGMRLLDIGCGWGALAKHAAEKYGANVVGVTISKQQMEYAQKITTGLPVEIRFQDYRDVREKFDRISSLGMFEHVGHLNYRHYLEITHRCLADEGLFLLHTIGSSVTYYKTNPWTDKYIFPNGALPSIAQIGKALEGLFVMEDWHNFGADYDKTLMAWHENFARHWEELKSIYDERFYRMWNFYLLSSAGSFRARDMQLWQIVLSKQGIVGGYQAIR